MNKRQNYTKNKTIWNEVFGNWERVNQRSLFSYDGYAMNMSMVMVGMNGPAARYSPRYASMRMRMLRDVISRQPRPFCRRREPLLWPLPSSRVYHASR
jgi:hypothetical protein